jgi:hypothetical protein
MAPTLGKIGRVQQIYHDNDLKVYKGFPLILISPLLKEKLKHFFVGGVLNFTVVIRIGLTKFFYL